MENELTRPAAWKFLAALILAAASARGAQTVNPSPEPAVKLPPYEVIEPKNRGPEKPNPLFDHPFANLRSGPLIEAILWRHHYLEDHPEEEAVIVTTHDGGRVISATTVYTREGKVYGSSNALGESLRIRAVTTADLHSADGLARIQKFLVGVRTSLSDDIPVNAADSKEALDLMFVTPESVPALEMALGGASHMMAPRGSGSGDYAAINSSYLAAVRAVNDSDDHGSPVLGALFVGAEESGDYRIMGAAAGPPTTVNVGALRKAKVPEAEINQMIVQHLEDNLRLRKIFVQKFSAPSDEVLSLTYRALRDSKRAGIVPVALASFGDKDSAVAIPPYVKSIHLSPHERTCLILDWEGIQYYYQPDIGTWAVPIPLNSITGLPYLCLKRGALMECAYFCATYTREYPNRKAQLVPGDPVMAAYETPDKLGIFIPALGLFSLPKEYLEALGDPDSLGQIRAQLVDMAKQKTAASGTIPEEMTGDDGDLQMRRALVAFQAAGIRCQLDESGQPSFSFTWDHVDYVYGPDQQVRSVDQ